MLDQPEQPLDRAVYWLEYVIRHKGAHHLRTSSRRLNFLQRDLVDIHLALFLTVLLIIYMIYSSGRIFLSKLLKHSGIINQNKKND